MMGFSIEQPQVLSNTLVLTSFFLTMYFCIRALHAAGKYTLRNTLYMWKLVGFIILVCAYLVSESTYFFNFSITLLWALPIAVEYLVNVILQIEIQALLLRASHRARARLSGQLYRNSPGVVRVAMYVEIAIGLVLLFCDRARTFGVIGWLMTLLVVGLFSDLVYLWVELVYNDFPCIPCFVEWVFFGITDFFWTELGVVGRAFVVLGYPYMFTRMMFRVAKEVNPQLVDRHRLMVAQRPHDEMPLSQYEMQAPQYNLDEPQYNFEEPRYDYGEPQYDYGEPKYDYGEPRYDFAERNELEGLHFEFGEQQRYM